MSHKPSLNFFSISKVLPRSYRIRLWRLSAGRIAANLLDLVGLAGVALLATSFGSLASGAARSSITLPVLGEVMLTELQAVYVALVIALVFILKSVFSIWLNLRTALVVAALESDFSRVIAGHFFSHNHSSTSDSNTTVAEFQNKVLYSTAAIAFFLNARISFIAEGSLAASMVLIFLLVNPVATISMTLFLGIVLIILNKMVTFKIRRNGRLQMSGYEQSLESSRDLFGIRREVISTGTTGTWIGKFSNGRELAAKSQAVIYTLNSLPRYAIETSLILGIFMFLGGIVIFSDLASQAVTIGVFMAGGLRLIASIIPMQSALSTMNDGANRGQDAFNILLQQGSTDAATFRNIDIADKALSLRFQDASFSYGAEVELLRELSIEIEAGTKTAIVGPSGAGKTTIFELGTGFLEPDSGKVLLEGFAPRDLIAHHPGVVGIVPQRPHLATGTLAENVSLIDHGSTDLEKVSQCLERAGLPRFLSQDLSSLSIEISPDAGELSGGEIQRLGLARALYRDPKILFLDEATSALDAETEALITRVLDSLKSEMTIVLIAHRLSTVMNADKIIYLDKGKVIAQGTFRELQKSVPDFSRAVELMGLEVA